MSSPAVQPEPGGLPAAVRESSAMPQRDPSKSVFECPLTKRYAIEVVVLGADNAQLGGIAVRLMKSEQETNGQVSDDESPVRFDGLIGGAYRVTLPHLDRDAWKLISVTALGDAEASSQGDIVWSDSGSDPESPRSHTVEQGDCISSIAFRAGFAPDTIWQDGENATLRAKRKDGHILLPGDVVSIPEKRTKTVNVNTGQRCIVQLIAIPEILRIRFLTYTRKPRAGVPYLLQITTEDGEILPDRKGETDGEGFLVEPIPPHAATGEIWLGKGMAREIIPVRLGHVNPLDDIRGVQARLNALNYLCGDEDGEIGELTRDALRRFQKEQKLPITGNPDDATLAKLESIFLS